MVCPPSNPDPIVISGIGLLSALGTDRQGFFDFLSGAPGKRPGLPECGEGPLLNFLGIQDPRLKIARYMDPTSKNAIVALGQALQDADLDSEAIQENPHNYGILFGNLRGPLETRAKLYEAFEKKNRRIVSGTLFSQCGYNMAAAMSAVAYGIKGPNLTFTSPRNLVIYLLRRGTQLLWKNCVHTIFLGCSTQRNTSESGDHSQLGELAMVLCMENKSHALQRRAVGYVEFEETLCSSQVDMGSFESGNMYVASSLLNDVSDASALVKQTESMNLHTPEELRLDEAFVPLIKLGFLVNGIRGGACLSGFLINQVNKETSIISLRRGKT